MKNHLLALGCAVFSGLSLSSCVVDPYGVPVGGAVYSSGPVGGFYGVDAYDSGFYGGNYGYGYAPVPVATHFSFFNGGGWGNNQCQRPIYSSGGHHGYHRSAPVVSSYASRVTRPSSFRGGSSFSAPPRTPSLPSPRTLSRPSFSAPPASPSLRMSAPSFQAPSMPRPSGRVERSAPIIQAAAPSFSAPPAMADSGRFGGALPSDRRRER